MSARTGSRSDEWLARLGAEDAVKEEVLTMPKPYYSEDGVTIYHGSVVNCDIWTPARDQDVIGLESAVKPYRCSSLDLNLDTSKHKNISMDDPGGVTITIRGLARLSQKKVGDHVRSDAIVTSGHAGDVEHPKPSDTISTEIRQTINLPTSQSCAVDATWKGTDA